MCASLGWLPSNCGTLPLLENKVRPRSILSPPLCLYKEEECQHLYTQLLFRVRATISRLSQAQTNILPPKTALQTIRIDVVCGPYVSAFERS